MVMHGYVWLCVAMYICMDACMDACMHISMYLCSVTKENAGASLELCVYVYVYVYETQSSKQIFVLYYTLNCPSPSIEYS